MIKGRPPIDQSRYPKPDWAPAQDVDARFGTILNLCEHGVGHPHEQWIEEHFPNKWVGEHACDGCCKGDNAMKDLVLTCIIWLVLIGVVTLLFFP